MLLSYWLWSPGLHRLRVSGPLSLGRVVPLSLAVALKPLRYEVYLCLLAVPNPNDVLCNRCSISADGVQPWLHPKELYHASGAQPGVGCIKTTTLSISGSRFALCRSPSWHPPARGINTRQDCRFSHAAYSTLRSKSSHTTLDCRGRVVSLVPAKPH
jgi:hypothetical protein